jgi:hypothetical protein
MRRGLLDTTAGPSWFLVTNLSGQPTAPHFPIFNGYVANKGIVSALFCHEYPYCLHLIILRRTGSDYKHTTCKRIAVKGLTKAWLKH